MYTKTQWILSKNCRRFILLRLGGNRHRGQPIDGHYMEESNQQVQSDPGSGVSMISVTSDTKLRAYAQSPLLGIPLYFTKLNRAQWVRKDRITHASRGQSGHMSLSLSLTLVGRCLSDRGFCRNLWDSSPKERITLFYDIVTCNMIPICPGRTPTDFQKNENSVKRIP